MPDLKADYHGSHIPEGFLVSIEVFCPQCNTKMNAPESAAGKKGKCKKCGGVVEVPRLTPELIEPVPEITPVEESYLDHRVKERQAEYLEHVAHDEAEANKKALIKTILGLAGAALLAVGVFSPLVHCRREDELLPD